MDAALAAGPPYRATYSLRDHGDDYVVLAEPEHVDAVAVHLGRKLPSSLRVSVFVLPADGPITALRHGTAGVVSFGPWRPPIDDFVVGRAIGNAIGGEPLDIGPQVRADVREAQAVDLAALPFEKLSVVFDELGAVASAGVVTDLETRAPVLAVWISRAFAEARVRAALDEEWPHMAFVYVTGASRLTPGLAPHLIATNAEAEAALPSVDDLTLARALHHALAIDAFFEKAH